MKKMFIVTFDVFNSRCESVAAHGGRLDSDGGHYNRKTGKYHTHRGGSNLGSIALIAIGGILFFMECARVRISNRIKVKEKKEKMR